MFVSDVKFQPKRSFIAFGISSLLVSSVAIAGDFGQWKKADLLPDPVSTASSDGCQFVSPDGLTMYLASNRSIPGVTQGGMDLFALTRNSTDEDFGNLVHISALATPGNDICPALSPDGQRLYFVSNRGDSCGGNDIYYATAGGSGAPDDWVNPVRLGCDINSDKNEEGPQFFVNPDDGSVTLYYSSNRPADFARFNIWEVSNFDPINGTSTSAPALIPGLNTDADDRRATIRPDGKEVIVESDRGGSSKGGYNLWQFTREQLSETFGSAAPVDKLNTDGHERRPTFYGAGGELYFMSSTNGSNDIWYSSRSE